MNANLKIMATSDLRIELHQLIDTVDDQFMQAVHGLVSAYIKKDEVIGYEADGTPVTANEFIEFADNAVKEMKEDKSGISIEELKERSKKWLSHSK